MAARKPGQRATQDRVDEVEPTPEPGKTTEPTPEPEKTTEPEPTPATEPKAAGKMVLVRNKARFDYVQPSTGITVRVNGGPTKVLDDGWIKAFVDAGLLEHV